MRLPSAMYDISDRTWWQDTAKVGARTLRLYIVVASTLAAARYLILQPAERYRAWQSSAIPEMYLNRALQPWEPRRQPGWAEAAHERISAALGSERLPDIAATLAEETIYMLLAVSLIIYLTQERSVRSAREAISSVVAPRRAAKILLLAFVPAAGYASTHTLAHSANTPLTLTSTTIVMLSAAIVMVSAAVEPKGISALRSSLEILRYDWLRIVTLAGGFTLLAAALAAGAEATLPTLILAIPPLDPAFARSLGADLAQAASNMLTYGWYLPLAGAMREQW